MHTSERPGSALDRVLDRLDGRESTRFRTQVSVDEVGSHSITSSVTDCGNGDRGRVPRSDPLLARIELSKTGSSGLGLERQAACGNAEADRCVSVARPRRDHRRRKRQESGRLAVRRVRQGCHIDAGQSRRRPADAPAIHDDVYFTAPEGPSAQPCTKSSQMVSMTYRICLMPVQAWVGGYRMRAA